MDEDLARERVDPLCLSDAEQAALLAGAPWRRFGVCGDSLSAGTGDPSPGYRAQGWADRVATTLRERRADLAYLNTAVIGVRTFQVLDDQLDEILARPPDLLALPCGGNDIVARAPDFARIEATMRALHGRAAATGATTFTFTFGRAYVVPAFPDWHERVTTINALTRRVAADHGVHVVDFWDNPVNERPDLVSADGIHFSTMGQAVMATEVVRTLAQLVRPDAPVGR